MGVKYTPAARTAPGPGPCDRHPRCAGADADHPHGVVHAPAAKPALRDAEPVARRADDRRARVDRDVGKGHFHVPMGRVVKAKDVERAQDLDTRVRHRHKHDRVPAVQPSRG
jgi:hypothetical protein